MPSYVLITPTRNEEATIGQTLRAVFSQTLQPVEWVIVSDGSTDRTNEIVLNAIEDKPFVHLLKLPPRDQRSFASVVHAVEAGVRAITTQQYDYIGLLDSDVHFEPDYFEKVIECFEASPDLGLAGGAVIDLGQPKDRFPRTNPNEIPGASHFFRRRCFEELGGLIAIPEGGWDSLTSVRARMLGYETRLLAHLVMDHLKPRSKFEGSALRRQWRMGVRDYAVGNCAMFEIFKSLNRLAERPLFFGSVARWLGYSRSLITNKERMVPREMLEFIRAEQMKRVLKELHLSRQEASPSGKADGSSRISNRNTE
jgi:poly-beta-1,6-N-acetyl-D-glucosamine synthase